MFAHEPLRLHYSFALQHTLMLRDTVLKAYQAVQELQANRRAQDVSKHTAQLKQTLSTMMFLASAEDYLPVPQRGDAPSNSPVSNDRGGGSGTIRGTVVSTLLLLTTWCEKNTTVTKALHETCCWEWVWCGMQRLLHMSRAPSPPSPGSKTHVEHACEVKNAPVISFDHFNSSDWREFSAGLRILANLMACSERRISEPCVVSGAFRAACQTVVFASHSVLLPALEGVQEASYNAAVREATKQAARLIGNACFGSGAPGKQCATDCAKQALLLEVLECPRCCGRPTDELVAEFSLRTSAECTCTIGALCALLCRAAPRRLACSGPPAATVDAPLTRWMLHILNEFSYGGAPNERQRALIARGVVALLIDIILALFQTDDEQRSNASMPAAESATGHWVLRDEAWTACAAAAIMTLHNVAFRLESNVALSGVLAASGDERSVQPLACCSARRDVLYGLLSDVVRCGDTLSSASTTSGERPSAAPRGVSRSVSAEALFVKAATMLRNRLPLFA